MAKSKIPAFSYMENDVYDEIEADLPEDVGTIMFDGQNLTERHSGSWLRDDGA